MNAITRRVLACELLQLVRDRRAVFAAVILPALLYPLIFWASDEIERSGEEILAARDLTLILDFSAGDPATTDRARSLLAGQTPISLIDADAAGLRTYEADEARDLDPEHATGGRRSRYRALLAGSGHALITADWDGVTVDAQGRGPQTVFRIYFDVKDDESREASERAQAALGELDQQLSASRRIELLGTDPARGLDLEPRDVASAQDASGAVLGRFLPLIAVLVLLSGGSYAALSVFAGERESGTLETLLVQPTPSSTIVLGKFLAVAVAGAVTLLANLSSLILCGLAGFGDLPGFDGGAGPGLARFALGIVYLPGAVLVCAVLCLVCGKARSFREGQQTILPVMILTALPTAVVMQPELETSLLLAVLPFAGAALCVRDAMAGQLALVPTLAMVLAHAGWSWLVLRRLGALLDAERVLSSSSNEDEDAMRRASARHGLRWGFVSVLLMYIVGTRLQGWDLEWGLGLTLWGLVVALAIAAALRAKRREAGSVRTELGLTLPKPLHLVAVLLCVPAVALGISHGLIPWQLDLLPMPQSMHSGAAGALLESWSTPLLLFLVAISPGVCEELLFRGAILSSLARDLSARKAVLWQAFFFALMHLDVYKLLPTFLLGLALGALTLRARSLWPAILAHAAYNGLQVLTGLERVKWHHWPYWPHLAWLVIPGLALLLLVQPGSRRGASATGT